MSRVQDCARALGEAIVASEEYQNMQLCEKAAESDPAAAEAMGRYMELHAAVNQEMGNEEPDAEKIFAPAGGEPVIIKVKEGAY